MAAVDQSVRQAWRLPHQLLRFFARFPPPQISGVAQSKPETVSIAENTSSADPNAAASEVQVAVEAPPTQTSNGDRKVNPFLPFRNPRTGNWHGPQYSLRRQADLYKLALEHDVLPLMPYSPKHPEVKLQKRIERGLRVQGTGEGKRPKGHQWERTLRTRLETRRKAMEAMPEMIRYWKQRGYGRGWKNWPK